MTLTLPTWAVLALMPVVAFVALAIFRKLRK